VSGAKNCVYTLDAMMRVAKVFVEDCSGCVVRVQSVIISQHVEVWACDGLELVLDAPVATVQVDGSKRVEVSLPLFTFPHFALGDEYWSFTKQSCARLGRLTIDALTVHR